VIFLCGVLVARGVRAEKRGDLVQTSAANEDDGHNVCPPPPSGATPAPAPAATTGDPAAAGPRAIPR